MQDDIKATLRRRLMVTLVVTALALPLSIGLFVSYFILGTFAKANIRVDASRPVAVLKDNWRGFAQGGEEIGARMIQPVIPHMKTLNPRYIRIDHVYDFYDVVKRDGANHLVFNWGQLDQTVCDIYATGAKPFFSLGYMPATISSDGTPIGAPNDWNEWAQTVQATIERYSGQETILCDGQVLGDKLNDIYYEVWNEPDLEQFGKWSIYGGNKSYLNLYYHAAMGADRAQNVRTFAIGGPSTTAPYRNWMQTFMRYVQQNRLRMDFLSWHKYSDDPESYGRDIRDTHSWLNADTYPSYYNVPFIVTEWGIDSTGTEAYNGRVAAAHAVAVVKEMIANQLQLGLAFEPVDGPQSQFGVIDRNGKTKPRYYAFKMLDTLKGAHALGVSGETDHIRIIAAKQPTTGEVAIIAANYDTAGRHEEEVPITISGLAPGTYQIFTTTLGLPRREIEGATVTGTEDVARSVYLLPNDVVLIEVVPTQ